MAKGHPVKKFRLTKKVKEACQILEDNPISDLTPGTLESLIVRGKLEYQRIYFAMHDVGYRWSDKAKCWKRNVPYWLQELESDQDVTSLWAED